MIFELWNNLLFTIQALTRVRATLPDFIYQRYSRFNWAGAAISYLLGIPLLLEYNGSEVWLGRNWDGVSLLWLVELFERLNLSAAQYIFVVSAVERENLLRMGVPESKIQVNPNGVNIDVFKPGQGGKEVRNKLNIDHKVVAGFAGTFCPWHGIPVLIEAITRLPLSKNCHFLLIGEGSMKAEVEEMVKLKGCADRITFTGRLKYQDMPAYLDACDILISPHVPMEDGSEFFGSPTKIFEYMAMARPIIASHLGQMGEVLKDQSNGLLLTPRNVEELVMAITQLADDAPMRNRLGAQARQDAINNHTWVRNAQTVITAYESLYR
jgi:glycosyltransferase involved in cell wall biosynthesis